MNEENSHEDGELFATDPNEELTETVSTTEDELFESSEGEENKEKPDKSTVAEEARQKQIRAWQTKIDNGMASIAELPTNQKWMSKYLTEPTKAAPVSDEELDRRLDQRLAALEEKNQFKARVKELNQMGLSAKKRSAIQAEFNDLKADGLPELKALERAIRYVGVEAPSRTAGVLPVVGGYAPKERDEELTSEQRVARLEELRKKFHK